MYELGDTIHLIEEKVYDDYAFDGYFLDPNLENEVQETTIVNQDLNIYAKYTLLRTLTIVNVDGTVTNLKYRDNSLVTTELIEYTLPDGYILEGYLRINDLLPLEETFTINSNMIIFPVYDLEFYTLTLVVEEGIFDEIDQNNSFEFTVENQPENLYFDNGIYQSTGFYLDEDLTIPYDENQTYLEDLTVFVGYVQYQVIVSLNIDQDVEYYNDQVFFVPLNGTIESLSEPFKYGYTFLGWSIEESDEMIEDLSVFEVDQNLSLVPNFDPIDNISYEFVLNNGETNIVETYSFDEIIEYPMVEKEGHTFIGWFSENNSQNQNFYQSERVSEIDSKILYAQWTVNIYELLIIDDGVIVEQNTYAYGSDLDIQLLDGVKEGYRFLGWSRNIPETMPAENVFIEAEYQQILHVQVRSFINEMPQQTIGFNLPNDNIFEIFYVDLYLFDGIIYGVGGNFYGSFGFDDLSYINDTFEENILFYNVSNHLDLIDDELITKISYLDTMVYAFTSHNRLLRWGVANEVFYPVEVVDVLDHKADKLLTGFDTITIITSLGNVYAYTIDNEKIDYTEYFTDYLDQIKIANNIFDFFDFENRHLHDGYSVFYTYEWLFAIGANEVEMIHVSDTGFITESNILPNAILDIVILDDLMVPPLFIFDNLISNFTSDDSSYQNASMNLNLKFGEAIQETIFSNIFGTIVPSFYTTYGRILAPRVDSQYDGTMNEFEFEYFDLTDYLLFDGEKVVEIREGYIITDSDIYIFPVGLTLFDFPLNDPSEWDEQTIQMLQNNLRFDVSMIEEDILSADPMTGFYTFDGIYDVEYSSLNDTYFLVKRFYEGGQGLFDYSLNLTVEEILNYRPTSINNYEFDGWYLDEDLTILANEDNITLNSILYPKYVRTHYSVQFILHETYEYGLDEGFDNIDGSFIVTYAIDELPTLPDISSFGIFEEYDILGNAYLRDDLYAYEVLDYDFSFAPNQDVWIYLTIVPKMITLNVNFPNNVRVELDIASGTYAYDIVNYFEIDAQIPVNKEIEGLYTDVGLTQRLDNSETLETSIDLYVQLKDEVIGIRYVDLDIQDSPVVFEYFNFDMALKQHEDGQIYLLNDYASILPISKKEANLYSEFMNVTTYFDLNQNEYITNITPLSFKQDVYYNQEVFPELITYFYAIQTSDHRLFLSGIDELGGITLSMYEIGTFDEHFIQGVQFSYKTSNQLFVLLDNGTLLTYDFIVNVDLESTSFVFNSEKQLDFDTSMVQEFLIYERKLIIVSKDTFTVFDIYQRLSILEQLNLIDDTFIGSGIYPNYDFLTLEMRAISAKGTIITYALDLYQAMAEATQLNLLENEYFIYGGDLLLDDNFSLTALTNLNRLYIVELDTFLDISSTLGSSTVVEIKDSIVLEEGALIFVYYDDSNTLISEKVIFDLDGQLIVEMVVFGLLKLSNQTYFNIFDESIVVFEHYHFLDNEITYYTLSSKPNLNDDGFEIDNFFGWTLKNFGNSIDPNNILTELPNSSKLIFAVKSS